MTTPIITNISKQRLLILSVSLGSFMCVLDIYVLGLSLPTISTYFKVNTGTASWVVILYLMMFASTLLFFGKLGDRIGFWKLFIAGYLLFCFGSLVCGLSWHIDILFVGRCIQGLGGAILRAAGPPILNIFLPENVRGKAFGIRAGFSGLGIGLGAPLGGIIITYLGWRWIFFINIPIGIFAIIVIKKLMPLCKTIRQETKFDITGAIISFICILSFIYALNMGNQLGWMSPIILSCLILFFVSLIFFIYYERKRIEPILDIRIFKNLDFTSVNLAAFSAFMLLAAINFLLPFYLIEAKGLSVIHSSMIILIYSLITIFLSPIAGKISDMINPRHLYCVGIFIMVFACCIFVFTLSKSNLWPVVIFFILIGIAYSFFLPTTNYLVMRLAPYDKQGVVSGIFKMFNILGMAVGVSIFGIVFSNSIKTSHGGLELLKAVPTQVLLIGFRNAFILGIIISIIGLVLALLGYFLQRNQRMNFK